MSCIKVCGICSGSPEVRAAVEFKIRNKTPAITFKMLAAECGFSKSSLNRHSVRHMADSILDEHLNSRFKKGDDVLVVYMNQPSQAVLDSIERSHARTWLVMVHYAPPLPERIRKHPPIPDQLSAVTPE